MNKKTLDLRDQLVVAILPQIPFEGWTWDAAYRAAGEAKIPVETLEAIFPEGLQGIVCHFSDWADRQMLAGLSKLNPDKVRVRDRIQKAAETRFDVLTPHKDAVRLALAYWSVPPRHLIGSRVVWRTADQIWLWAGDTAKDYNRYTKRALLSGILTATTLVWLKDSSETMDMTKSFLDRRIENVLQFGQILSRVKAGRGS